MSSDRDLAWFRSRCDVSSAGCWEWRLAKNANGYGYVYVRGSGHRHQQSEPAHAAVARLVLGPRPAGHVVLHSCDNRACINPAHLSYGTQRQNNRDMWARGRGWSPITLVAAERAARTHCREGHEYTEANTYITKQGHRACRRCHAAYERRRKLARALDATGYVELNLDRDDDPDDLEVLDHA